MFIWNTRATLISGHSGSAYRNQHVGYRVDRPQLLAVPRKKGSAESALSTKALSSSTHDPQAYQALRGENWRSLLHEVYRKVVHLCHVPASVVVVRLQRPLLSRIICRRYCLDMYFQKKKTDTASLQPADPRESMTRKLAPLASRLPPFSTDDVFFFMGSMPL